MVKKALIIFLPFLVFMSYSTVLHAQSWHARPVKIVKRVKAKITKVDAYDHMLSLRAYTNEKAGEYKVGWCFVDAETIIMKDGKEFEFRKLRKGDEVYVGGVIYSNSVKTCKYVTVID